MDWKIGLAKTANFEILNYMKNKKEYFIIEWKSSHSLWWIDVPDKRSTSHRQGKLWPASVWNKFTVI